MSHLISSSLQRVYIFLKLPLAECIRRCPTLLSGSAGVVLHRPGIIPSIYMTFERETNVPHYQ